MWAPSTTRRNTPTSGFQQVAGWSASLQRVEELKGRGGVYPVKVIGYNGVQQRSLSVPIAVTAGGGSRCLPDVNR